MHLGKPAGSRKTREAVTIVKMGSSENLSKVVIIRKARRKMPEAFKQSG